MKLIILPILLLICAMPTWAADKWSKEDYYLETTVVALIAADYWMTDKWVNKEGHKDQNPFLGSRPSRDRLIGFGILGSIGHATIAHYLPTSYRFNLGEERFDLNLRKAWQYLWIGVQAGSLTWNFRVRLD